jgi:hypothetical protein
MIRVANCDGPDHLPILLAKECHGSLGHRLLAGFADRRNRIIRGNSCIDEFLDAFHLPGCHGFGMVEVKAEMGRRDQRTGLTGVFAQHLVEGCV